MSEETPSERGLTISELIEERNMLLIQIEEEEEITPEVEERLNINREEAIKKARSVHWVMLEKKKDIDFVENYIKEQQSKLKSFETDLENLEYLMKLLIETYGVPSKTSKAEIAPLVFKISPTEGGRNVLELFVNYTKSIEKKAITLKQIRNDPRLRALSNGVFGIKVDDPIELYEKAKSFFPAEVDSEQIDALIESMTKVELIVDDVKEEIKKNLGIVPDYLEDLVNVKVKSKTKFK